MRAHAQTGAAYLKAKDAAYGTLTRREQEVMRLPVEGLPRIEIAGKLFITKKTLENHTTRILNKSSLRDTGEVLRYAERLDLIESDW